MFSVKGGVRLGGRSKPTIIEINPYDNIVVDTYANNHTLIVGSSGSGKTWATASIMVQLARQGWRILAIDRTGEYGELEKLGLGNYVYGEDIGINILKFEEAVDVLAEAAEYIYGEAGRLTPIQYSLLDEALSHAKNLSGARRYLEKRSRISDRDEAAAALAVLRRLKRIMELKGFNSDFGHIKDNAVIDVSPLASDISKNLATLVLVYHFYNLARRGRLSKTFIVIDEAQHVLCSSPLASIHIIEKITREGRRYGVYILISTQGIPSASSIVGSIGNFFAFRLNMYEDAYWAARNFTASHITAVSDVISLLMNLPTGWSLVKTGRSVYRVTRWEIPDPLRAVLEAWRELRTKKLID